MAARSLGKVLVGRKLVSCLNHSSVAAEALLLLEPKALLKEPAVQKLMFGQSHLT